MSNQPTVSFHTIYAETVAEQIMLATIQVQAHVKIPTKKSVEQMLLSYNNHHRNTILQCAAYWFRAKQKNNALFIQISENQECFIQNPANTDQIGRSYNPYIKQSTYPISDNSRISISVEKHLSYLWLLTQVENISILHIPADRLFDQSIIDTIHEYKNPNTIIIYLSNYNPSQKDIHTLDALIHTLRQHINKNQQPETITYKTKQNPLYKATHHLHQAI
jgi:hypothetical protein